MSSASRAGGHAIGPEIVVRLEYRLYDAEGALVEAPGASEIIEFIFGVGQASPTIERAVEGLRVGDSRRVRLSPREAFGPRDEDAVIVVERSELPGEASLGDEFEAESDQGEPVFLRVIELDDDIARLDANHPLAGQSVTLELTVVETRIATSAELRQVELEMAAEAASASASTARKEPDVLASSLVRRARPGPPASQ